MDIGYTQFAPRYPRAVFGGGGTGLGGQQFKRVGNVVKRLDRLGINFAHNADESGNGHMLNTLGPCMSTMRIIFTRG